MTYMKIVKNYFLLSKYKEIIRILVNNGCAPPLFTKIQAIFFDILMLKNGFFTIGCKKKLPPFVFYEDSG